VTVSERAAELSPSNDYREEVIILTDARDCLLAALRRVDDCADRMLDGYLADDGKENVVARDLVMLRTIARTAIMRSGS
jgi:hypothetical protein